MSMQQILIMNTSDASLRSNAWGWDVECGDTAYRDLREKALRMQDARERGVVTIDEAPVGFASHPRASYTHTTPLHAIAQGWRLMGPPVKQESEEQISYDWWFEKMDYPS